MTTSRMKRLQLVNGSREAGAALVTSLAILLILTILGIAAMRTSSIEERMAGNIQDSTLAFTAAESGLVKALNEPGGVSLTTDVTKNYTIGSSTVKATTAFKQFSPPKRGSGYSNKDFDSANFDQNSEASTPGGAKSAMHRGVSQIVPKAQ